MSSKKSKSGGSKPSMAAHNASIAQNSVNERRLRPVYGEKRPKALLAFVSLSGPTLNLTYGPELLELSKELMIIGTLKALFCQLMKYYDEENLVLAHQHKG